MNDATAPLHLWALLLGVAILLVYEGWVGWLGQRSPQRVARRAHARLRSAWVVALGQAPGFEIVAVQTLRNSLMSATITASTAALCMMGLVSLSGAPGAGQPPAGGDAARDPPVPAARACAGDPAGRLTGQLARAGRNRIARGRLGNACRTMRQITWANCFSRDPVL